MIGELRLGWGMLFLVKWCIGLCLEIMSEWKIRPRAAACRACGASFSDGQVYHTLLFDERREYSRTDVCQSCWDGQYGHGAVDRKGFVSHWRAKFLSPPPSPPEPVQRETAESALRKLAELGERRHHPVCFILAAMLERKRILKVREESVREGSRVFVYEHAKSGDVFAVHDPELKLTELAAVQREVAELLRSGVDAFLEERKAADLAEKVADDEPKAAEEGSDGGSDAVNAPAEKV